MSEMQRNRGIVKRISTAENSRQVFDKLVADGIVEEKWCEYDDDAVHYIDHDDYEVVNGAIFDVSGAPDEGDGELGVNEAERLNETDYRVHAYYYNGGADLGEMLSESIPVADKAYAEKPKETEVFPFKETYDFLYNNHKNVLEELEDYLKEIKK